MVLIDDDPLAREGLLAQIRAQPGFRILAASAEIEEALRRIRETRPEVVLLNLRREGGDSLTLAGALHGEVPEPRVIVMGLEPLQEDMAGLIRAGVSGFIMSDASLDTFLSTIHSVAQGIRVLPLALTGSLFGQLKGNGGRRRPKRRDLKRPTVHSPVEVAVFSRSRAVVPSV